MIIQLRNGQHKNFTIIEDECPTKAFLNIENRKQEYHKIVKLKINYPDYNEDKPNVTLKVIETTDQELIRKATKGYLQKYTMNKTQLNPPKMT